MNTDLVQILQLTLNGVAIGAIYALVALGLVLTYKATEVLNFAYGDVLMASSFVGWGLIVALGWPFWLAALGTITLAVALNWLIDARVMRMIVGQPQFAGVMRRLLAAVRAPVLVVSFNNEGYLAREEMESMLAALWDGQGKVTTIENDFKRYVGAQIGIYNPQGEKVGKVSHLRNKEFLYVVTPQDFEFAPDVRPKQAAMFAG